jgi:Uma2 family endonuclease
MSLLVLDKWVERRLRAQRRAWGADKHDEVWEGVYVMSPLPDLEHQELVATLAAAFHQVIVASGLGRVFAGANVSDREVGWKKNYRAPDLAIVLRQTNAKSHDIFWTGAVDFVVEIISRGDRSRKKLPFYSRIGVRELLFIDRSPWQLQLYRHDGELLQLVGNAEPNSRAAIDSEVIPFSFHLTPSEPRPVLHVTHKTDGRSWQA